MGRAVRFAIVGAGIAGLSAAWEFVSRGERDFLLLEASDAAGGLIGTTRDSGFLMESGPDSFLASKPVAAALCREVGLEPDLIPTLPQPAGPSILHDSRLDPLPAGWRGIEPTALEPVLQSGLFSPSEKEALAAAWPPAPLARAEAEALTIAGYLRRRYGNDAGDAILARVAAPLAGGVYGGDAETLSVLPWLAKRQPGAPAPAGFLSLRHGLGSLPEALLRLLPPANLILNCPVASVAPAPGGSGYHLALPGETLTARAVILALPAWAAAKLLRGWQPDLAATLGAIAYGDSVNINLGFASAPSLPAGHGLLIASPPGPAANLRWLACTFAHQKFPGRAPAGTALLRMFYAGADARQSDASLLARAQADLDAALGVNAQPVLHRLQRWPQAMPQLSAGDAARLHAISAAEARLPGLALAGNAYGGVGLPDCIASGRAAAQRLLGGAAQ
ncbi:MAG: protoporphyrinogen/coproporphyrinogen oxidase [Terriglobales bacterium]